MGSTSEQILGPYLSLSLLTSINSSSTKRELRQACSTQQQSSMRCLRGAKAPPTQDLVDVRDYWTGEYDGGSVQDHLNRDYRHHTTTVHARASYTHAIRLHFVHYRSERKNAIPLLMLHGWPSSFLEWSKIIELLTNPPNDSMPAFHVVAPSLPGFAFSPAPEHPGLGPRETGQGFDDLMRQLHYDKYSIYTTDLGTFIGYWMLPDSLDSVTSHITDFFFATPNATDLARYEANQTTRAETSYIAELQQTERIDFTYMQLHGTRPLSVAIAMTDSPIGFVAWIWDLMWRLSGGYAYSADDLITDAMMLSIQRPYGGIRDYLEWFRVRLSSCADTREIASIDRADIASHCPGGRTRCLRLPAQQPANSCYSVAYTGMVASDDTKCRKCPPFPCSATEAAVSSSRLLNTPSSSTAIGLGSAYGQRGLSQGPAYRRSLGRFKPKSSARG